MGAGSFPFSPSVRLFRKISCIPAAYKQEHRCCKQLLQKTWDFHSIGFLVLELLYLLSVLCYLYKPLVCGNCLDMMLL